jgi:hypothetical protein
LHFIPTPDELPPLLQSQYLPKLQTHLKKHPRRNSSRVRDAFDYGISVFGQALRVVEQVFEVTFRFLDIVARVQ